MELEAFMRKKGKKKRKSYFVSRHILGRMEEI